MAYRYVKESDVYCATGILKPYDLKKSVCTDAGGRIHKIGYAIPVTINNRISTTSAFYLTDAGQFDGTYRPWYYIKYGDMTVHSDILDTRTYGQWWCGDGQNNYICGSSHGLTGLTVSDPHTDYGYILHAPYWDPNIKIDFDYYALGASSFPDGSYISVWLGPDILYNDGVHTGTLLGYGGPVSPGNPVDGIELMNTEVEYRNGTGGYYTADIRDNDALYRYGIIICITYSDDWAQIAQTY